MIILEQPSDINWENVVAIAYGGEKVGVGEEALGRVTAGRALFWELIGRGVPCYGVTTGLGKLVGLELSEEERAELPAHILRARSPAIGPPLAKSIARATMVLRLVNFLSGKSAVTPELCQFICNRLNDDFVPWIPSMGHGMASDAIAHTHTFQTLIGEGFVFGRDGARQAAREALTERGIAPFALGKKEGLALLNGVGASPAYALDAHRELTRSLALANGVAAVSVEGSAARKEAFGEVLAVARPEPGVLAVNEVLRTYWEGSEIKPFKLQSPVSYRVIPQVHGALHDALAGLRERIEATFTAFSDNPLMVDKRFLSVGLFHNQHLVNQVEHVAIALAQVGVLSMRRLHRLMDEKVTGLSPQLATRPGLDAGLVPIQKSAIGLVARLRWLAHPVSLATAESSGGQEDMMALVFPAIGRLYEMSQVTKMILAYELLAGLVALDGRGTRPGLKVRAIHQYLRQFVPPLMGDRSPSPDVEAIVTQFETEGFQLLIGKSVN